LKKRSALVTGGTRGIGEAIARKLLHNGASVAVTGTRKDGNAPEGCTYHGVDFTDRKAMIEFVSVVKDMGVDILINNAGINKIGNFSEVHADDFDMIQEVNIRAPFLLCQAVVPGMKQKKWGRIINITSIFGKVSKELRASYSASKFALDGMTSALAAEVTKYGILANCVAPGVIDTDLTRAVLGSKGIMEMISRIPAGRLGNTDEIASFVVWLAGPENTYISGQNIAIDGGFTRV